MLYGTAVSGGTYGYGVIFKMDPSGSGFQVLRHFDGTTGAVPYSTDYSLLFGQDGIYGTTNLGGAYGMGVVYKLAPSAISYSICPLYDQTKPVKSGSTVPIKIQLCDGSGGNLSAPSIVVHGVSVALTSNNISETLQDSGSANPDND
ncbi:MAG: hypothetical protein DMG09_20040, partial [Acidobacteria bacterium]